MQGSGTSGDRRLGGLGGNDRVQRRGDRGCSNRTARAVIGQGARRGDKAATGNLDRFYN